MEHPHGPARRHHDTANQSIAQNLHRLQHLRLERAAKNVDQNNQPRANDPPRHLHLLAHRPSPRPRQPRQSQPRQPATNHQPRTRLEPHHRPREHNPRRRQNRPAVRGTAHRLRKPARRSGHSQLQRTLQKMVAQPPLPPRSPNTPHHRRQRPLPPPQQHRRRRHRLHLHPHQTPAQSSLEPRHPHLPDRPQNPRLG